MAEPQQQEQQLPLLLDSSQVAWILNLSPRTVEIRSVEGEVPGFVRVFDRHPRWRRDIILQWIRAGCPDVRGSEAQAGAGGAFESKPVDEFTFAAINADCGNRNSKTGGNGQ